MEWGVVGAQRGLAEACTSPDCTANALNSLSPIGACMQWHLKPWGPVARCTALGLRAQVAGRCNLFENNQAKCSHLSSPRMLDCSFIERRKEVLMHALLRRSIHTKKTCPPPTQCGPFFRITQKNGASHGRVSFPFWRHGCGDARTPPPLALAGLSHATKARHVCGGDELGK